METTAAEGRYLTDAVFHARVERIVQTIERERGVQLDRSDHSLASLAVAVALVHNETTGV